MHYIHNYYRPLVPVRNTKQHLRVVNEAEQANGTVLLCVNWIQITYGETVFLFFWKNGELMFRY